MDVRIGIEISPLESQWILGNESLQPRLVIAGAIVIEPCPIILPSRVLERIRTGAGDGGLPKRLIGVGGARRALRVTECEATSQRIRVVMLVAGACLSDERLIDVQTPQIARADRAAANLGGDIIPIV